MNTTTIILLVMIAITGIAHISYIHYRKVKLRKKVTTARLLRIIQLTLKSHGYYNQKLISPEKIILIKEIEKEIMNVLKEIDCYKYTNEVINEVRELGNKADKDNEKTE